MNDFESSTLRAENNPKFYSRFKWLGLGAFAFMLYCLYDGYINYPDQQVRGMAFFELAEEKLTDEEKTEASEGSHGPGETYQHIVENLAEKSELAAAWEELAVENGWDVEPPAKLRTNGDIVSQYIMATIAVIAGVWMLLTVWRANGRWIELADDVVQTSWGQSFPVVSITQIDKRQWRDKGIAKVRYTHDGKSGKFVVDDYKYHRQKTDEILRRIEAIAGVDKITGGPPEEEPEAATLDGPAEAIADATRETSGAENGSPA